MGADLRTRLKALVEEWRKWCDTFERKPTSYEEGMIRSKRVDAQALAALLAESEPNPGKTHYQGDDCPGGHASVCGYCGAPCPTCRNAPGEGEPVLRLPRAPRAPA